MVVSTASNTPLDSPSNAEPKTAVETTTTDIDTSVLPEGLSLESLALMLTAMSLGFVNGGVDPTLAVPEVIVEAFSTIPASLVHPAVMWIVVAVTLRTFYLGYQSSQIRKVEPEERKKLVKARVTDKHFKTSSALFAVVTLTTFGGMANTYTRAGKLFPGPHLYAGLGIITLMSMMSALVPYMQKGENWARNVHFGSACAVTGLFLWQAKSGMWIVGKLLKLI